MSEVSRVFISPLARRLIREHGLQSAPIVGSGPGGRIVRRDVQALISVNPGQGFTQVPSAFVLNPHSRMRKAIARRLSESKSTVPHFYLTAPVKVDQLLELRKKFNESSTIKVSVTDLMLKITAAAYQDVPAANVVWNDEGLKEFNNIDIAVAVATEKGLMAPVVRNVAALDLNNLSSCTSDLISRARSGKLKIEEIEGGSISITNLGMYGTDQFAAILNPPHSLILAVGAAKPAAVVVDDQIKIATVINMTLSVDHRAIDGALAAQWFTAFVQRCEKPEWLFS